MFFDALEVPGHSQSDPGSIWEPSFFVHFGINLEQFWDDSGIISGWMDGWTIDRKRYPK